MTGFPKVVGVILAGGRATRFGSDKALAGLAGRPLIEHVVWRARPQVDRLVLNLNENRRAVLDAMAPLTHFPVVCDLDGRQRGPLAGVLAAMEWTMRQAPECDWIASFAVDSPLFPDDMVQRMIAVAAGESFPVIAASGGRAHPTFGLWPASLRQRLYQFLMGGEKTAAMAFARLCRAKEIDYPIRAFDPFLNINRLEDLAAAAACLGKMTATDNE